MIGVAQARTIRIDAQRFELGSCALKLGNHFAITLPSHAQVGILCFAAAIKAAPPCFVLGLDALVMALDPIEASPKLLI
jgi:hypothetical protein